VSDPDGVVNSLTITQTSVVTDLGPGRPAAALTGAITNNGPDSTHITAINVEITSVTLALDASPGTCSSSDYELFDARMPVGHTLAADGGSTVFSGASLGFADKTTQQDACQRATVHLLYTAVSSPPVRPPVLPLTGAFSATAIVLGVAVAALLVGAVLTRRSRSRRRWNHETG
jgi:LPXTG-motif cell wall-anchored protein